MASEIAGLKSSLDAFVTTIENYGTNYFVADAASKGYTVRLRILKAKHNDLEEWFMKYELSDNSSCLDAVKEARKLLIDEVANLNREADRACCPIGGFCQRMLFPKSVGLYIDAAENAYNYIRDYLDSRSQDEEKFRKARLEGPSSQPLQGNRQYISFEDSEKKICSAFSAGSRVVLLHGGPGRGKSTLAREISARYKKEKSDFTQVVILECGPKVNVTAKMADLVQKLGGWKSTKDLKAGFSLETLLEVLLRGKFLIVLDDLWEDELIQSLLHSSRSEDGVKFLISSQLADLCKSVNEETTIVPIEDLNPEASMKILATYAGFGTQDIPQHLRDFADKIILHTGANPMLIATLGAKIASAGPNDEDAWSIVSNDLSPHLDDKAPAIHVYGKSSTRSFLMTMKTSFTALSDSQKDLLVFIGMCKGPSVAKSVLQLLYTAILQVDKLNFKIFSKELISRHLVDENDIGLLSIHSLTKRCILKLMKDTVERIIVLLSEAFICAKGRASSFESTSSVTGLVDLYIDTEFKRAPTISIARIDSKRTIIGESFMQLLLLEPTSTNKWTLELSECANKVFSGFVYKDCLDNDGISKLLDSPTSSLPAITFLQDLLLQQGSFWEMNSLQSTSSVVLSLLHILQLVDDSSAERQTQAASALAGLCLCCKANAQTIVNFPGMLPQLGMALTQIYNPDLQRNAVQVLYYCAYWGDGTILGEIASHRLVDKLVTFLYEDQNYSLQKLSVDALYYLANHISQRSDRHDVANWSNLLEGLARLLISENPLLQYYAAWTMGNVASHSENKNQDDFLNHPGMVEKLVKSLYVDQNSDLQQQAARTLRNLAEGSTTRKKTVGQRGLLEALKVSLTKSGNAKLQYRAAETLAYMSDTDDITMLEKLLDHPGLMDQLAKSLHEDQNDGLQVASLETLYNMTRYLDGSTVRKKIVDWSGLLEGLRKFQKGENKEQAGETLTRLTAGHK